MKILFLNTNIGYGGASKIMVAVANRFAEDNDVTFLSFLDGEIRQPINEKINVVYDPLYKNKNKLLEIFVQTKKLHTYIKKEKFDLAVAFLI